MVGKLFASRIDEVFLPIFHSKRDQEKKNYKLHFLITSEDLSLFL
jgi:hypothetical protein